MATRSIDRLPLQGFKLLDSQTRQFPRKYPPSEYNSPWGSILIEDAYGYIYDSVDVPQDVIDACCEEALAIYLANQDPMGLQVEKMQARGATSASIGSEGSETWSLGSKNIRGGLKSEEAYNLLSKYISRSSAIV
jgi:hypothetical protein